MKKNRKTVHKLAMAVEALEERRMMADTWGAISKLMGQDAATNQFPAITGAGYSVAVLDTGIDYNHPVFGGNGMGPGKKIIAGWDFVGNDADPMDSDGHGTGVAAMAAASPFYHSGQRYQGAAPGANIIALRVDDGTFSYNKEAPYAEKALQWVIANAETYNIVSVNMSFGRGHYATETTISPIDDELATLGAMGIMLVSSSGNDGMQNGTWGIEYPGADPNVYSVGSVNPQDVISTWTERSDIMDLLAPGENMVLPYYLPATGQHIIFQGGYGSSFSAPWVAGMAAMLKQIDPSLTPAQMIDIMKRSGVANYDGDNESGNTTGLTFQRLSISGAVAMALTESDDAYENNDVLASATALNFSGNTASASDLKLLLGDADFYKFTLSRQADVEFSLTTNASSTPSWDLYNAAGVHVKTLTSGETVRLGAATWYIKVNAPAASLDGTYGISITQTPDDAHNNHTLGTAAPIALDGSGYGELSGLVLLGGSDDYFSFILDGTYDMDLAVEAGSAQLMDSNGNFVASFDGGGELSRRLSAGQWFIKVSSATTLAGTYGVTLDGTLFVTPGQNGSANGIVYDASGTLHFAYYDDVAQSLKYATRGSDGVWSGITVIDGVAGAGQYVNLVLDSAGRAGVAYYDASSADLKYAHYNGSTWDVETVDAKFTVGYYPSLRYDAADRPVITYYAKTGGDLKMASFTGSAWSISTIDSSGDVGRYSSLLLHPGTGRWAVAYEDDSNGAFKYAEQTKSSWNVAVVDSTTKFGGGYVSLGFTKSKLPVISYYDGFNADLKVASYNGSRWSAAAVASKGTVGLYSTLRVDQVSGDIDVLYYSKSADAVMRARNSAGVWSITQVTMPGGRSLSRAVDADGGETLAYFAGSGLTFLDL